VAKFEMHGKALAKNQLLLKAVGPMLPYHFMFTSWILQRILNCAMGNWRSIWQMAADFVADFFGKTGEAWQNLTQEPASEGSGTQPMLPYQLILTSLIL
jgi:hypothetical protein